MIFLKNISDLRSLMRSRKLFSADPVILQIPELSPGDTFACENRINGLKNEKGWSTGIKGACVIVAVLSAILLNIPQYAGAAFFSLIPFVLISGALTAIIVKIISMAWVRIRLKNEIKRILRRIRSLEKKYAGSWLLD